MFGEAEGVGGSQIPAVLQILFYRAVLNPGLTVALSTLRLRISPNDAMGEDKQTSHDVTVFASYKPHFITFTRMVLFCNVLWVYGAIRRMKCMSTSPLLILSSWGEIGEHRKAD